MDTALISLIALCGLLLGAGIGVLFLRAKLREFSRSVFGTDTLHEGLERQQIELSETPKSVSSMTNIYLPQIARDFPEFDWPEFRERAKNVCLSWLAAVDTGSACRLTEGAPALQEALRLLIERQKADGVREKFQRVVIHDCEISRYRKEKGRCTVLVQIALESTHTVEQGGKVVRGRTDLKEQSVWAVEAAYIQESGQMEGGAVGVQCPFCGAPITNLGQKRCEYCGGAVAELNIRAWQFQKVYNTEV